MKLSGTEYKIMQAIWQKGGAVTSQDVLDRLPEAEWKQPTVLTFLARLQEKGMLVSEKKGRVRYFTPCVSQEEYARSEAQILVDDLYGGSVGRMVACLTRGSLTEEDKRELKKLLEGEWK